MQASIEVFKVFLRLGCTSFGGPVAHLGYFHRAFVNEKRWLSEEEYANLVAVCQFLPGPASSQVAIGIGLMRAGMAGALLAWAGFLLPSAVLLSALGFGLTSFAQSVPMGLLAGLKTAAVAVVAQAVWTMAGRFCTDRERVTLAVLGAAGTLLIPTPAAPLIMLVLGGLLGQRLPHGAAAAVAGQGLRIRRGVSLSCLILLALCLTVPALTSGLFDTPFAGHWIDLFHSFLSAGSLVFGGGHVVLPLLQATVVTPGWVTTEQFLAGYGAAQAVPGPLFSLAAYLGTVKDPSPNGWLGALYCLGAIYLPSFLLLIGVLPFWTEVRSRAFMRKVQEGLNAVVVGILLAALYEPIWTATVHDSSAFLLAVAAFVGMKYWNAPSWLVVILCAAAGWIFLP